MTPGTPGTPGNTGPVTRCAVRAGSYHDSIVLMQLQRALSGLPGVIDAGVVMATPANLDVLAAGGLAVDVESAPGDLLVAVKAETEAEAAEALARVDARRRDEVPAVSMKVGASIPPAPPGVVLLTIGSRFLPRLRTSVPSDQQ